MDSRTISPRSAWSTMLRATSEMAVAMRVRSEPSKPMAVANARPFWRATTISAAELIATCVSFSMFQGPLDQSVQVRQSLFELQGRSHALQSYPQLHHGKS